MRAAATRADDGGAEVLHWPAHLPPLCPEISVSRNQQENSSSCAIQTGITGGSPRIAFDFAGRGEPVVFLHGVGGNRGNWSSQLPEFSRHFLSIAWDARGYGDSDDYNGSLDFADFSADLLRLYEHFGIDSAHIVGLSMGGNIALHFAVRYGTRVRSLVLCDTDRGMVHIPESERQTFLRLRRDPLLAGSDIADMAPALVESLASPNASDSAKRTLLDSMLLVHKESYIRSVEATLNFDIRHDLHRIACPTLVVVGELDRLTPVSEAKELCAAVAGARLVVIPGAGHVSNVEKPDAFNQVVLQFLLKASSIPAA